MIVVIFGTPLYPSEAGGGNDQRGDSSYNWYIKHGHYYLIKSLSSLKLSMFSETLYLIIEHSYKYHSITSQQQDPHRKFLSSAPLFCYHCVQFALKAVFYLLIASNYLWGCKADTLIWITDIKESKRYFRLKCGRGIIPAQFPSLPIFFGNT